MNYYILAIIVLIVYILLWFIINLLAYFVSIALKTQKIFSAFLSLVYIVCYIFNFLVGIWLIWFGITLLIDGHYLWLIVYLFIGASVINFLVNLFQIPFIYTTAYFSEKLSEKSFNENIATAEVIDKNGRVIRKIEGETAILVRLAKYFILLYFVNLASVFLRTDYHEGWRWGDFLIWPFLWLVSQTVVIGVIYIIYHKLRYRLFLPEDRKDFFIQVWRICLLLLLIIGIFIPAVLYHRGAEVIKSGNVSQENTSEILKNVYDQSQWDIDRKVSEDIDGDDKDEEIFYLKSKSSVGSSALDDQEFGVKIVIAKDGELIFEYSPSEDKSPDDYWPVGYYRPDINSTKNFFLEDITGDEIPEIIVRAGIAGASDMKDCLSIINYNKTKNIFELVNKEGFCYSFNVGIKIEKLSSNINGQQIVKATPLNGQIVGNKVEQVFEIFIYTWNGKSFSVFKKYRSSRPYEGGGNAVEGEIYLIRKDFWNISSFDLATLEKEQQIRDLKEKADAYRQMIELQIKKQETLQSQINLMNEQINRDDISGQEKMKLIEEKNALLKASEADENKYKNLLLEIERQKEGLLK